ncbi:hypothetical protein FACS1894109_11070 [Spirochaetia bacterium]|nr:hypothetical protein FACS1894109_11070 [Spirochaetia bacterium]
MATGKSLEKKEPHMVRVYYNKDGSPIKRQQPKEHMSKKERLRQRRERSAKIVEALNAGKENKPDEN